MDFEKLAKRLIELGNILYRKDIPVRWEEVSSSGKQNTLELLAITKASIEEETGEIPSEERIILTMLSYLEAKHNGWIFNKEQ